MWLRRANTISFCVFPAPDGPEKKTNGWFPVGEPIDVTSLRWRKAATAPSSSQSVPESFSVLATWRYWLRAGTRPSGKTNRTSRWGMPNTGGSSMGHQVSGAWPWECSEVEKKRGRLLRAEKLNIRACAYARAGLRSLANRRHILHAQGAKRKVGVCVRKPSSAFSRFFFLTIFFF